MPYAGGILGESVTESTSSGLIEVESRAVDDPAGRPAPVVPSSLRPASFPSLSLMSSPFAVPVVWVGPEVPSFAILLLLVVTLVEPASEL